MQTYGNTCSEFTLILKNLVLKQRNRQSNLQNLLINWINSENCSMIQDLRNIYETFCNQEVMMQVLHNTFQPGCKWCKGCTTSPNQDVNDARVAQHFQPGCKWCKSCTILPNQDVNGARVAQHF